MKKKMIIIIVSVIVSVILLLTLFLCRTLIINSINEAKLNSKIGNFNIHKYNYTIGRILNTKEIMAESIGFYIDKNVAVYQKITPTSLPVFKHNFYHTYKFSSINNNDIEVMDKYFKRKHKDTETNGKLEIRKYDNDGNEIASSYVSEDSEIYSIFERIKNN